eukprot:1389093-Amorphochlora_amoeboformis.AAC.2
MGPRITSGTTGPLPLTILTSRPIAWGTTRMSENIMAASRSNRRMGWSVIYWPSAACGSPWSGMSSGEPVQGVREVDLREILDDISKSDLISGSSAQDFSI